MCLILHANGHLTVKVLLEQIWPMVRNGQVQFLECYDFIFRSHSPEPLDRLYILSPQSAGDTQIFVLQKDSETTYCDWPLGITTSPDQPKVCVLRIPSLSAEDYGVTRLYPQIDKPTWLKSVTPASATFTITQMTMSKLTFKDQCIRQFDKSKPNETTYWLRLAYFPKIIHRMPKPTIFGPLNGPATLNIWPCEVLSPSEVLRHLENQLDVLSELHPDGARGAYDAALMNGFCSPATSTRVEDHRISFVTDRHFMLFNTVVEGPCGFLGAQQITPKEPRLVRTWFNGAKYYPANDALSMTRLVYKYLRESALNEKDAKTKEAISSAIAPDSHSNVSHIVEALRKLDYVQEVTDRKGWYFIKPPLLDDGQLFLANPTGAEEYDFGKRDGVIRNALYGELPLPDRNTGTTRFEMKGVRLHCDLAFHPSSVLPEGNSPERKSVRKIDQNV